MIQRPSWALLSLSPSLSYIDVLRQMIDRQIHRQIDRGIDRLIQLSLNHLKAVHINLSLNIFVYIKNKDIPLHNHTAISYFQNFALMYFNVPSIFHFFQMIQLIPLQYFFPSELDPFQDHVLYFIICLFSLLSSEIVPQKFHCLPLKKKKRIQSPPFYSRISSIWNCLIFCPDQILVVDPGS